MLREAAQAISGSRYERSLQSLYYSVVADVRSRLDGEPEQDEFDELFNAGERFPACSPADTRNALRFRIAQLAGWIDGLIESIEHEARMQLEAREYAEARLNAEKRIGFEVSSSTVTN